MLKHFARVTFAATLSQAHSSDDLLPSSSETPTEEDNSRTYAMSDPNIPVNCGTQDQIVPNGTPHATQLSKNNRTLSYDNRFPLNEMDFNRSPCDSLLRNNSELNPNIRNFYRGDCQDGLLTKQDSVMSDRGDFCSNYDYYPSKKEERMSLLAEVDDILENRQFKSISNEGFRNEFPSDQHALNFFNRNSDSSFSTMQSVNNLNSSEADNPEFYEQRFSNVFNQGSSTEMVPKHGYSTEMVSNYGYSTEMVPNHETVKGYDVVYRGTSSDRLNQLSRNRQAVCFKDMDSSGHEDIDVLRCKSFDRTCSCFVHLQDYVDENFLRP